VPASSKDKLLEAGLAMLLERGYHDLGIQALLEATALPNGSFYHHFKAKEDFALQVIAPRATSRRAWTPRTWPTCS